MRASCISTRERKECVLADETRDDSDTVRSYIEILNKSKESLEQNLEEKEKEMKSLHAEQLRHERTVRELELKLATAVASYRRQSTTCEPQNERACKAS